MKSLFVVTSLDDVLDYKFIHEIAGADVVGINIPVVTIYPHLSQDAAAMTIAWGQGS